MTLERSAVVIGAGKVARGFAGHLLHRAGFAVTFVDVDRAVVAELADRRAYTVHVLGAPSRDGVVDGVTACHASDEEAVRAAVARCGVVFVSVGGTNLEAAAATVAPGLAQRQREGGSPLNVVVCENWRDAGATFRRALLAAVPEPERPGVDALLGVAESTIMRSCIAPTPEQHAHDPLAVQVQDFWRLPIDGAALVAGFPDIPGVEPTEDFGNALERKLYTYNMANALISYLGWLAGHDVLSRAANDERIVPWVLHALEEVGEALCRRFGFAPEDQDDFAAQALRKFQTPEIVDPLVRQVRQPLRKLGRHDRLVGAAMLAQEEGVTPEAVALGIAAALHYRNPDDPEAVELEARVAQEGLAGALATIGEVPVGSPLSELVVRQAAALASFTAAEH